MQKWEYHIEAITYYIDPARLADLGNQGWELVAIVDTPSTTYYYFKRPK